MNQENGVRDWAIVLKKLEEKLDEERTVFQEKIKQAKVINDGLKLHLEQRERELREKLQKCASEADNTKTHLSRELTELQKELQDRQSAWSKMGEKKDNEILVQKEEFQTLTNTLKEERKNFKRDQEERDRQTRTFKRDYDRKNLGLEEQITALQGRIQQREAELKSEHTKKMQENEKKIKGSMEGEIRKLRVALEQERTTNEILSVKTKELENLRADVELKNSQIKTLYEEKINVEKIKNELLGEIAQLKKNWDNERLKWEDRLKAKENDISDLIRAKDEFQRKDLSWQAELKEMELKLQSHNEEVEKEKREWEQTLLSRDNEIANLKTTIANLDATLKSELVAKEDERDNVEKALKADLERVMARLDLEKTGLDMGEVVKLKKIKSTLEETPVNVKQSPDNNQVSPPSEGEDTNPDTHTET